MKFVFHFFLLVSPVFSHAAWTLDRVGLGTFARAWGGKTPPAALVRFQNQSLDSKAYVLGCGHCNNMPLGGYVADEPVEKMKAYIYNPEGRQIGLPVTKIVFGTKTVVDLILLELSLTYREIEANYGIPARVIAEKHQPIGTEIGFYNLEQIQYCQIDEHEDRHIFSEDGSDYLRDTYVYYDCISRDGHSGSILVSRKTNEVIGLNVGGLFPGIRNGVVHNYGSEVSRLYSCLNESSQFDINRPTCKLRIGEPGT